MNRMCFLEEMRPVYMCWRGSYLLYFFELKILGQYMVTFVLVKKLLVYTYVYVFTYAQKKSFKNQTDEGASSVLSINYSSLHKQV